MNKKKIAIITSIIITVLLVSGGILLAAARGGSGGAAEDMAYVNSVATITNAGGTGIDNRYSGTVEAQQEWKINLDSEKQLKDVFVEVGQEVQAGTDLFSYDNSAVQEKINQANIDLERINNEITDKNKELKDTEKAKRTAPSSEKLAYTTQIQTISTELKQKEYEKQGKEIEIEQLNTTFNNSTVKSQIAGVVKYVNKGQSSEDIQGSEGDSTFMTILATGDFLIKGTANEQNVSMLTEGEAMIVRSRVDDTKTWTGVIEKIDTDNPNNKQDMSSFYDGGDTAETSMTYPFYLKLDSTDGLILGQHIYIEPDLGQGKEREGLWLEKSYIVQTGAGSFVWADNGKDQLEKRKVELGDYDEELLQYEIKSGLALEDYIAFPMDYFKEGMKTQIGEPIIEDEMWKEEDYIPEEEGAYILEENMNTEDLQGTEGN